MVTREVHEAHSGTSPPVLLLAGRTGTFRRRRDRTHIGSCGPTGARCPAIDVPRFIRHRVGNFWRTPPLVSVRLSVVDLSAWTFDSDRRRDTPVTTPNHAAHTTPRLIVHLTEATRSSAVRLGVGRCGVGRSRHVSLRYRTEPAPLPRRTETYRTSGRVEPTSGMDEHDTGEVDETPHTGLVCLQPSVRSKKCLSSVRPKVTLEWRDRTTS